jgi:hypothetical protein
VLPTSNRLGPVSRTGVIPDEPALTRVVAAGSGVSCGSVPPDADACGVACRVALRLAPLPKWFAPPTDSLSGSGAVEGGQVRAAVSARPEDIAIKLRNAPSWLRNEAAARGVSASPVDRPAWHAEPDGLAKAPSVWPVG